MTFVRYAVIQLLAYGIDMGLFLTVLHSGISGPIWANATAKIAAGFFAFTAHRSFTFRVGENTAMMQQGIRYFTLLILNVPVASGILALLLIWVANPVAAKFVADVTCVALTFWLSKHCVFVGPQKNQEKNLAEGRA